jgi:hypothetical protein
MKAIDRATYWIKCLEQAGFEIERETRCGILRNEYLTVRATKGYAKVMFTIQMDTPRTRFITGGAGNGSLKFTKKPSEMSSWIACEVSFANYCAAQEATA